MQLRRFVERWTSPAYPPDPITVAGFDALEATLGVRLPRDYREALLTVGLPRPTIALLDAIVDGELNLADASDFYAPDEIGEHLAGWNDAGLPSRLIPFATDSGGNLFCFDRTTLGTDRTEEAPVWFFDHDFLTVEQIAPGFDAWIGRFCDLPA